MTLADVIRRKAQEREDRRVREAEERAEARAEARFRALVRREVIQMIDQLNRNEAGSSEVRFSREELLQFLENQVQEPGQKQNPND